MSVSVINNTDEKIDQIFLKEKLEELVKKEKNLNPQEYELSCVLVDKATITKYAQKYLHEEGSEAASHPVLSFVQDEIEGEFKFPPDEMIHLGEIIVSVDHARENVELNNTSLVFEVRELALHGCLHLLGHHHD